MSEVQTAGAGAGSVEQFIDDPFAFFGHSFAQMHSLPREQIDALQREGLRRRFDEQLERIPMLRKLASELGIDSVDGVESVVPLLFEHTMYKSYGASLLEQRQFGNLTKWMAELTSIDLSSADTSGCDSIDGWRDALVEAGLDTTCSSGTSGKMSFFPWSPRECSLKQLGKRVIDFQVFGKEPTKESLEAPLHYIGMPMRPRHNSLPDVMGRGRDGYVHYRTAAGRSAGLAWLSARQRQAVDELAEAQAFMDQRDAEWLRTIEGLQGETVFWLSYPHDMYAIAAPRVERGERWTFSPDSKLVMTGGMKGNVLPEDWLSIVERFLDIPIATSYGMTELSAVQLACPHGRFHVLPWIIPFALDPDTSELLPRSRSQTGRAAFFDILPTSHWGGLITGDEIEIAFDRPCECGATTPHLGPTIRRLSELGSGEDKITRPPNPRGARQ